LYRAALTASRAFCRRRDARAVRRRIAWQKRTAAGQLARQPAPLLDTVYAFASTRSLARELRPVEEMAAAAIGDVFVHPGSPGHAVIIVDLAVDPATAQARAAGPEQHAARDVHILRNTLDPALGAWFALTAPPARHARPRVRPERIEEVLSHRFAGIVGNGAGPCGSGLPPSSPF